MQNSKPHYQQPFPELLRDYVGRFRQWLVWVGRLALVLGGLLVIAQLAYKFPMVLTALVVGMLATFVLAPVLEPWRWWALEGWRLALRLVLRLRLVLPEQQMWKLLERVVRERLARSGEEHPE